MAGEDDFTVVGTVTVDDNGSPQLNQVNNGLDEMRGKSEEAGEATNNLGMIADFVWAQLIVKGIESAIEVLSNFGETLKGMIEDAADEQDVMAQITNQIEQMGEAAPFTTDALVEMGEAIGQTTTFGHDAALSAESLLLRFHEIGTETFPQVMQAGEDLATGLGRDLTSTVRMLGRTLEDPTAGMGMLKRMMVVLTDEEKTQIKTMQAHGDLMGAQKVILDAISAAYGGSAAAAANTYHGQLAILHDTMSQLGETLGEVFLPLLTTLTSVFQGFATDPRVRIFFEDVATSVANVLTPVENLVEDFKNWGSSGMNLYIDLQHIFGGEMGANIYHVADALRQFVNALSTGDPTAIMGTLTWLLDNIGKVGSQISQKVLGWIKSIDWKKLSDDLAGYISSIDWSVLGARVGEILRNVFKAGWVILSTTDWKTLLGSIGMGFADFVTGAIKPGANFKSDVIDVWTADFKLIDTAWHLMWKRISDTWGDDWVALKLMFTLLWARISEFFENQWTIFKSTWAADWDAVVLTTSLIIKRLEKVGSDIIKGLLTGLKTAWTDVTAWIHQAVEDIEALFRRATKSHSPSEMMADIGRDLMAGLGQGITANISNPANSLSNFTTAITNNIGGGGRGGGSTVINLNVSGAGDPRRVADEIVNLLKLNGVQVTT